MFSAYELLFNQKENHALSTFHLLSSRCVLLSTLNAPHGTK